MSYYMENSLGNYEGLNTTIDSPVLNNPFTYDYNFYGGDNVKSVNYEPKTDYLGYVKSATGLISDFLKGYIQYDTSKKLIGLQDRQLTQRENELQYFKTQQTTQKDPIIMSRPSTISQDRYIPMPMQGITGAIQEKTGISQTYILIGGALILGIIILKRRLL